MSSTIWQACVRAAVIIKAGFLTEISSSDAARIKVQNHSEIKVRYQEFSGWDVRVEKNCSLGPYPRPRAQFFIRTTGARTINQSDSRISDSVAGEKN